MPLRRFSLAILASLLLVAGCHSTTAPATSAVFLLTSIDGRPLPTTWISSSGNVLVLHQELILDDHGVATRSTSVQGATPSEVVTSTVQYAYTQVDGVVTLGNVLCGPGALCILHVPERGPIDGGMLTLSTASTAVPTASVLVYHSPPLVD